MDLTDEELRDLRRMISWYGLKGVLAAIGELAAEGDERIVPEEPVLAPLFHRDDLDGLPRAVLIDMIWEYARLRVTEDHVEEIVAEMRNRLAIVSEARLYEKQRYGKPNEPTGPAD